jgi:gas vesicle protein
MAKRRGSRLAMGALVAAGIGYAAGVLTAPKSGRETRRDLQRAALKAKKDAEAKLKKLHSDLDELIVKGKSQTKNLGQRAKADMNSALDKAQKAKDKTRQLLSAIHEGEAEDKDLQKAIKEVKDATEHLKKFIKKDAKPEAKS